MAGKWLLIHDSPPQTVFMPEMKLHNLDGGPCRCGPFVVSGVVNHRRLRGHKRAPLLTFPCGCCPVDLGVWHVRVAGRVFREH